MAVFAILEENSFPESTTVVVANHFTFETSQLVGDVDPAIEFEQFETSSSIVSDPLVTIDGIFQTIDIESELGVEISNQSIQIDSIKVGSTTLSRSFVFPENQENFFFDGKTIVILANIGTINIFARVLLLTNAVSIPVSSITSFLNVKTINVNRQFRSPPSGSIELIKDIGLEQLICQLQALPTTITYPILGMEFILANPTIEPLSLLNVPGEFFKVSLSLVGKHSQLGNLSDNKLDKPILFSSLGQAGGTTSIAEVAARAGIGYQGFNDLIDIPKRTGNSFTTLRKEINSRAIKGANFPFYSDSIPKTKRWSTGVTTHFVDLSEILDISYSHQGLGQPFGFCVRLDRQYRNTRLNLKRDLERFDDDGDRIICLEEFENCNNFSELTVPGLGFDLNEEREKLRTPSANFDNGGLTKTFRRICTQNGSTISIEEEVYGYSYSSGDTYIVTLNNDEIAINFNTGIDPRIFWGVVQQTTTTYTYGSDRYLKQVRTVGDKKVRFRQESENLEVAEFLAQRLIAVADGDNELVADIDKQINLFVTDNTLAITTQFIESKFIDIDDTTIYQHDRFRDYYNDLRVPDAGEKDTFVEPKFVRQQTRKNNQVLRIEDPLSDPPDASRPDLVVGDSFEEETKTEIIIPRNASSPKRTPEKFRVLRYRRSATGEFLNQSIVDAGTENRNGRPSVAPFLKISNKSPSAQIQPFDNDSEIKYYLFSFGQQPNLQETIEEGSVSYPDLYSTSVGLLAAKTALDIENSSKCRVATVRLHRPRLEIQEGDVVFVRNERFFVISISQTYESDRPGTFLCKRFELKLGKILDIPVTLVTVRVDEDEDGRTCGTASFG